MKRVNKRLVYPQISDGKPVAEGLPLDSEAIDAVAQLMYNRFYQVPGGPDFKSLLAEKQREELNKRLRESIDCLKLKGFRITLPLGAI